MRRCIQRSLTFYEDPQVTIRTDTVNVTKRPRPHVRSTSTRRSRVPEIETLLAGWTTTAGLNWFDQARLIAHGLAHELDPARRNGSVSANGRALLLLDELERRRQEAYSEPSERVIMLKLLDEAGYADGLAAYRSGGDTWARWEASNKRKVDLLFGARDKSIESTQVVKSDRKHRYVLGERQQNHELYERLRDELGAAFIARTTDREAKVRQWERRRRLRADREAE